MLWCTQLKHYIKSKATKSRRLTLAGAFFISYFYRVLIRFFLDILYKNKVKWNFIYLNCGVEIFAVEWRGNM